MPELPEVETVRRDLLTGGLVGRRLTGVVVNWPRAIAYPVPESLAARLAAGDEGATIRDVARRGKYLLLRLAAGDSLIVHLRMTGRLLLRGAADAPDPYLQAVLGLDDGRELRFCDMRKFGRLWLVADESQVIGKLGPEPLNAEFGVQDLARQLAGRRGPLKALLLDQGLIAGIGNIYADEALFVACLHPQRPANGLSGTELARLHAAIRQVLQQGIANRGTTVSNYMSAFGRPGRNQEALRVFRRTGQPCPVCAASIARIVVGGRSTHFCPQCQGQRLEAESF